MIEFDVFVDNDDGPVDEGDRPILLKLHSSMFSDHKASFKLSGRFQVI